jgi:hypothetical protein
LFLGWRDDKSPEDTEVMRVATLDALEARADVNEYDVVTVKVA